MMRFKKLALILALSVGAWAQTATPNSPVTPQSGNPPNKDICSCCDKMAGDAKASDACCANHSVYASNMASSCPRHKGTCCGAKSKARDVKAAMCSDGAAEKDGKPCCNSASKACAKNCCSGKEQKAAKSCCHKGAHSQS
ncbi:MAG TPA: hypothetical protein VKV39_16305 [Candidatus Sulfotelmatobacter sp.]|nr:hypothetical protein [Candidatus Sulfotelmatobacter sp.]